MGCLHYELLSSQSSGVISLLIWIHCRDFPRPDLGPNIPPSRLKYNQKFPKMVYIIPNFLVLHFGKNFMKI